jgi:hypothetical protein
MKPAKIKGEVCPCHSPKHLSPAKVPVLTPTGWLLRYHLRTLTRLYAISGLPRSGKRPCCRYTPHTWPAVRICGGRLVPPPPVVTNLGREPPFCADRGIVAVAGNGTQIWLSHAVD